jgi:enoyl-CoA hydratase/carnithine racemase
MIDMRETANPIQVEQEDARYWRVRLNNPPLNLLDPEMVNALHDLIGELERSEQVRVVVFESALPDFFMAHVDLLRMSERSQEIGPTGMLPWADFLRRMEQSPVVTIGLIRGRARGVGSEFLQAFDMRFASREKAAFAQIEVGCGIIPGGGGLDRLPGMVGRGRAMEIVCGADDFDADTAERYGWINRSLPDAELDGFVDRLARRVASFEKETLALAKKTINERVGLASVSELDDTYRNFRATLGWPGAQRRIALLTQNGLQTDTGFERDLAAHVAEL